MNAAMRSHDSYARYREIKPDSRGVYPDSAKIQENPLPTGPEAILLSP
jgi:hypothetical protein